MNKKAVLIIDQDRTMSASLSDILEGHGFFVICMENMRDGLRLVREVVFDIVIFDTGFPGPDAEVSSGLMRQRCPQARIISTDRAGRAVVPAIADAVVRKPIDPEVLLSLIREQ
jgi:DNA-binding response OmpR family regulator